MPIVILPNPNGGNLGTGLPLRWNRPEGVPDGAAWRVIIYGEGGTLNSWLEAQRTVTSGQTGAFWRPFMVENGWGVTQNIGSPLTGNQTAHADVQLVEAGNVTDSVTVNGTWDATSGLPMMIEARTGSSTGGFTETDRQNLGQIQLATVAALPVNLPIGQVAQTGLSALVEGPPDQLLRRGETILLTGDGSVTRPPGSGSIQAYGAIWDFRTVPPGFGADFGPVLEYGRRMAQLAVIRTDAASNEFTHDLVDIHSSFGKLRFPWNCRRIDYHIAPGVTLSFTWLIFVVGN